MHETDKYDEIIKYTFGLSIYSLFENVKHYDGMSYDEHKEAFLQVLKHLLSKKIVMLIAPGADVYRSPAHIPELTIHDKEAQWDISPENAIQYFRDKWPKNIRDSNDSELIYFLYEMPDLIWIADDGSLHAS